MSIRTTLGSAVSGLRGASAGISATSHNVANATTEGFSRRSAKLSTETPLVGRLVLGQGVDVAGFRRATNERLVEQQIGAESDVAASMAFGDGLRSLEAYFDPIDGGGPRDSLDAFYDSLTTAAQDPGDPALRRDVIASGDALARTINRTSARLTAASNGYSQDIALAVDDVNAILEEVAATNVEIVAAGGPLRSGDMADRRDQLMREAARIAGVELDIQPDGTAVGRLGGHVVVSGADVRPIGVEADGTLTVPVGDGVIPVDTLVGGQMGGLVDARNVTDSLKADLNTTVETLVTTFNATHAGGFDRTGAPGGDLFSIADPAAPAGTLSFAIDEPSALAFAGDASAEAGDSGNLQALIAIEDDLLVGGERLSDAMGGLASRLGGAIRMADADRAQSDAVLLDLDELNAAISGVDLDEEAANLLTYQAAYQASAKVVQTADQLMGVLMEMA
jgi:flagellar hook-associated protein 1 FlgK